MVVSTDTRELQTLLPGCDYTGVVHKNAPRTAPMGRVEREICSRVYNIEPPMNNRDKSLCNLIWDVLQSEEQCPQHKDKRHPLRSAPEYVELKWAAAERLDELYEHIVRQVKSDISAIDSTIGHIAEPMAEQLASGAVADVFEAAAEVLKLQIRNASKRG